MVMRMRPERTERLLRDEPKALGFNVAAFRSAQRPDIRTAIETVFAKAQKIAAKRKAALAPKFDLRPITRDMIDLIADPEFDDETIASLLLVMAQYKSQAGTNAGSIWSGAPQFADYDISLHPSALRYGNVELRVVENYLFDQENLHSALEGVIQKFGDESSMYTNASPLRKLIHDDIDFNLRRLMTNAGFYISDVGTAWDTLTDWVQRYIAALCNSRLFWHNAHGIHYLRIQRALHERCGAVPEYLQMPGRLTLYDNLAGRDVLFVSPLAHIVNEQISSGRLWNLYESHEIPRFSVRAIPAWISTWPNRPHSNWSETFLTMCEGIETAYRERPFDVFMSACGCYGLPISDHVRAKYGCPVIYKGHNAHMLFGLFPGSSGPAINPEMWAQGDLDRYANVDRIDGGRYI
jgi:hypothetical protein